MKHAIKLVIPTLLLTAAAAQSHAQQAQPERETVYVWPFATQNGKKDALTRTLTQEFEEALTDDGYFDVLERSNLPRLWAQRQNEPAILEIFEVPPQARSHLVARQADMVVFGEVHDDQNSGEVIVTVVLQDFSGRQRLAKTQSFTRGKRHDPDSRRKAMQQLVQELSTAARRQQRTPPPPRRIPLPPLTMPAPAIGTGKSVESQGFLFVLQGCQRDEALVSCRLQITSLRKERKLMLYTTRKDSARDTVTRSLIHARGDRHAVASQATIADKQSYFGRVSAVLQAGRPADVTVQFKGFPSQAASIERLELACKDLDRQQDFTVELHGIPLGP